MGFGPGTDAGPCNSERSSGPARVESGRLCGNCRRRTASARTAAEASKAATQAAKQNSSPSSGNHTSFAQIVEDGNAYWLICRIVDNDTPENLAATAEQWAAAKRVKAGFEGIDHFVKTI